VSPDAAADTLCSHLEAFFVPDVPRSSLDVHFVPDPRSGVPDTPPDAAGLALLDGLVPGWNDPQHKVTTLFAPQALLAPKSIRAFAHLLIPSFYDAHYDGNELCGVLLHASAVEFAPGAAGVFLAASQGGKSTVAEIARPSRPVLHEEVVVLTEEADGSYAVSTGPWPGLRTSAVHVRLPLGGQFLIEKADAHALIAADGAEAHGRVLAQIVFAQDFRDRSPHDVLESMARFCERLCARVPPDVLRFRPDAGFLGLVEDRVRSRGETA
jgi:hypothetical protein